MQFGDYWNSRLKTADPMTQRDTPIVIYLNNPEDNCMVNEEDKGNQVNFKSYHHSGSDF